jgi:hypothetical protein
LVDSSRPTWIKRFRQVRRTPHATGQAPAWPVRIPEGLNAGRAAPTRISPDSCITAAHDDAGGPGALSAGGKNGSGVQYLIGTMIEGPRGAVTADEIAKEAEFFSFGTISASRIPQPQRRCTRQKLSPPTIRVVRPPVQRSWTAARPAPQFTEAGAHPRIKLRV